MHKLNFHKFILAHLILNLRKDKIEGNKGIQRNIPHVSFLLKKRSTYSCLHFFSFSLHKSVTRSNTSNCETMVKSETMTNPIMDAFMKSIKSDRGSVCYQMQEENEWKYQVKSKSILKWEFIKSLDDTK